MNRRGFFTAIAASAIVSIASSTRIGQTALALVDDPVSIGQRYVDALVRSIIETKDTLAANILNRAFEPTAWETT